MEHDAMCPVDLRQRRSDDGCQCGPTSLIARVRADQQQRDLIGFGALPDEDAIRADERERAAGRVTDCDTWVIDYHGTRRALWLGDALAAIREGGA